MAFADDLVACGIAGYEAEELDNRAIGPPYRRHYNVFVGALDRYRDAGIESPLREILALEWYCYIHMYK